MAVIDIKANFGEKLSGKTSGKQAFGVLCGLLSGEKPGNTICLDFGYVQLATGSWLNACLGQLLRWTAVEDVDLFPVICNPDGDILGDLELIADLTDSQWLVTQGIGSNRADLIGPLDTVQMRTLTEVLKIGTATGAGLCRTNTDEDIVPSAWNNRLRDLNVRRLLKRSKSGREQIYVPVFREILIHGRQLPATAGSQLHETTRSTEGGPQAAEAFRDEGDI